MKIRSIKMKIPRAGFDDFEWLEYTIEERKSFLFSAKDRMKHSIAAVIILDRDYDRLEYRFPVLPKQLMDTIKSSRFRYED